MPLLTSAASMARLLSSTAATGALIRRSNAKETQESNCAGDPQGGAQPGGARGGGESWATWAIEARQLSPSGKSRAHLGCLEATTARSGRAAAARKEARHRGGAADGALRADENGVAGGHAAEVDGHATKVRHGKGREHSVGRSGEGVHRSRTNTEGACWCRVRASPAARSASAGAGIAWLCCFNCCGDVGQSRAITPRELATPGGQSSRNEQRPV